MTKRRLYLQTGPVPLCDSAFQTAMDSGAFPNLDRCNELARVPAADRPCEFRTIQITVLGAGRSGIARLSDDVVQHLALLMDSLPEVVRHAVDLHVQFEKSLPMTLGAHRRYTQV